MTRLRLERIHLDVDEMPGAVRYTLPRRQRRAWGKPLLNLGLALVLYLTIPTALLLVAYQAQPSVCLLPLAAAALILCIAFAVQSVRTMVASLTLTNTEIELRTGYLTVSRRAPWRRHYFEVPLSQIRRLSVRFLAQPVEDPVASPTPPTSADEFPPDALHYFGNLYLEGDDDAAALLAEKYGQTYLLALAADLTRRIHADGWQVSVQQDRANLETTDVPVEETSRDGIVLQRAGTTLTITVAPPKPAIALFTWIILLVGLLSMAAGAWLCLLAWGLSLFALILVTAIIGVFCLVNGARVVLSALGDLQRDRTRTVLRIDDGALTVTERSPLGRRRRHWHVGQFAACSLAYRTTRDEKGKTHIYHLVLLDQAMGRHSLLAGLSVEQLEWLAGILRREMALGR